MKKITKKIINKISKIDIDYKINQIYLFDFLINDNF